MCAVTFGQPLEGRAVEPCAIEIATNRVVLRSGDVNPAAWLVDPLDRLHLPRPFCQTIDERAVGAIAIEVLPTIALAAHQE